MESEKVLVSGGAGFIGSHLVDVLEINNHVTVIDNLASGRFIPKKATFIKDDIKNLANLDIATDRIFHLAALINVEESVKNPRTCHDINMSGLLEMLEYARKNDVKSITFSSSAALYGDIGGEMKEEGPKAPISMYGATKLCGEEYLKLYQNLYGIKASILRYFNVYGPRQNLNSAYASVIPKFIGSALKNEQPVIYGDGNQTRDFIFVKDIIDANLFFADRSGTFNIGTGTPTTINSLFGIIKSISGFDKQPVYKPEKKGDIKYSFADVSKAKKQGFVAKTSLQEGIKQTIEAIKNEKNS